MPITHDRDLLRSILNKDRAWAVYPIGDLDDRRFSSCEWRVSSSRESFVLLFHPFPILVAGGDPREVVSLLDESLPPSAYLHIPRWLVPCIQQRYARVSTREMVRMSLARPAVVNSDEARLITREDISALERLYADGEPAGEAPDFFQPSMLEDQSFFAVWEDGAIVSAAGTHLVAPTESVAAIGNVYTRRDRRGRGLGALVTSAVVRSLLDRGTSTIALSVVAANVTAIRVYERLGFTEHCRFFEGKASAPVIS